MTATSPSERVPLTHWYSLTYTHYMDWLGDAACRGMNPEVFFPTVAWAPDGTLVEVDADNHARAAKAVCAGCDHVASCVLLMLRRNERFGVWGGAGGKHRRLLRRQYKTRFASPEAQARFDELLDRHVRRVRGERVPIEDVNGPGATHGIRATYAKGCRCEPCRAAAGMYGYEQKVAHAVAPVGPDRQHPPGCAVTAGVFGVDGSELDHLMGVAA